MVHGLGCGCMYLQQHEKRTQLGTQTSNMKPQRAAYTVIVSLRVMYNIFALMIKQEKPRNMYALTFFDIEILKRDHCYNYPSPTQIQKRVKLQNCILFKMSNRNFNHTFFSTVERFHWPSVTHYRVAPPSNCLQWYLQVGRHDSDRRNTIDCQDVKKKTGEWKMRHRLKIA